MFSLDLLVSLKLLDPALAPVLREMRTYNPLLFDFVLKRQLRSGGSSLVHESDVGRLDQLLPNS